MRLIFRVLLAFLFIGNIANVHANGILIFEISDAQNKPVEGLPVVVKQGDVVYKNYTTNESGRVVDLTIPSGLYTYSFEFGDLGSDTFEVKEADYTWINLDYRQLSVTFKDDEGTLMSGKKVSLYRVREDLSKVYVGEKFSDESGSVSFLIPEGTYEYTTLRGTKRVVVKDENINSQVEMTSGEITHETFFSFINDKKVPLTVYAKDIYVTHIAPDSVYPFGAVDAHGDRVSYGFYEYNTTENSVSCPAGTYTCKVETKDYGTIKDTFVIDENDPILGNIVYLVLPTLPNQKDSVGDDDRKEKLPKDSISLETPYQLTVFVFSSTDSVKPIAAAPTQLYLARDPEKRSEYGITNVYGEDKWYVGKFVYDLVVMNDTMKGIDVKGDTTVYMYLDSSKLSKVYFDFFFKEEPFNPVSISSIEIASWREDGFSTVLYGRMEHDSFLYDKPVLLPYGSYLSSFYIDEKDYHQMMYKSFVLSSSILETHVETRLIPHYTVNIVMKDVNGMDFESRQYIEMVDEGFHTRLVTDSVGHYTGKYLAGPYDFIAFGDTQHVDLDRDTTLYFQSSSEAVQRVKFQFLHDGKLVYPQIMSMDIKLAESDQSYSKAISHFYDTYEGRKNVWVFDEPTLCELNNYYVEYTLKDYEYNGTFRLDYKITNSQNEDTLIYIVVPVKRSVTITIKDANTNLVTGVFGNIYKYDENGTLMESLTYDNGSHEGIRTNSSGQIIDHLVPGRYQLRILDIKRDFIVKDYDLSFEIISGTKMYDVKYVVKYKSSKAPVPGLLLDVTKEGAFYNTTYTDEKGEVELFCEAGNYAYDLHYGEEHSGAYALKRDTTINLYIEDPILVETMTIIGCACVPHNDTLPMKLLYTPEKVTLQDFDWSVDNEVLAHMSSDGSLITNDVAVDGYVTVTVRSKDGSGVMAQKRFYISNSDCGPSVLLHFAETEDLEVPLTSDSLHLRVATSSVDEFDRYYLYQASSDSVKWETLVGPTDQTEVVLPATQYHSDLYLRVLSSSSQEDVARFVETMDTTCGSNKISNQLTLRINHLKPVQWPDSICVTAKEITLEVSTEELGNLAAGYTVVWYAKPLSADTFQRLDADGLTKVTLPIDSTTTYKAVVQKDTIVASYVEQTVFVEQLLDFKLKVSEDTVCLGDTILFWTEITEGEAGDYLWNNGLSISKVQMIATEEPFYVTILSRYNLCPSRTDTISLTVDKPIDFSLSADRTILCKVDTMGVDIKLDTLSEKLGKIVWSTGATDAMIHIVPQESGDYSATVSSPLERCPQKSQTVSIKVNEPLGVTLDADKVDICQEGTETVTLTAHPQTGEVKEYVWWNGEKTLVNTITFVPEGNVVPSVYVRDGVCPDSAVDSVEIKVAKPSSVTISSPDKIFEYRTDINLTAGVSSFVYGPYTWYAIDAEGNETQIGVTEDSLTTHLPDGDVSYYVTVENGACPIIVSGTISMHLADNIVIPTLFTPYTADGQNDDFMPGYPVIIYDRYGDIVCHSENGWDGMYRGKLADPGVYYYVLTLKDERVVKGTIELFRK